MDNIGAVQGASLFPICPKQAGNTVSMLYLLLNCRKLLIFMRQTMPKGNTYAQSAPSYPIA